MLLSNRDTQNAQLAYTRDIQNHDIPNNSVVSIGFLYPQFAVLNRNTLRLGILETDTDCDQPAHGQGEGGGRHRAA